MLEKLIPSLIVLYQEDLRDYEELSGKMQEFSCFLNSYDAKDENCQGNTDNIKVSNCIIEDNNISTPDSRTENSNIQIPEREKSPTSGSPLKVDERLEQELGRTSNLRDEIFHRLRARAEKTTELQKLVCAETGSLSFRAADLKPYLEPTLYNNMIMLTEALNAKMTVVLKLDDHIIPRLKMELEAVKLELHRIQGAKKTKNAYEYQGQREARFIDKTK